MTVDEYLAQLTGCVAALQQLLAQTMVVALSDRPDREELLEELRAGFDAAAGSIERSMPDSLPSALETAERLYGLVEDTLAAE